MGARRGVGAGVAAYALDGDHARRLWNVSLELIGPGAWRA
jgi:hypothetical protein